MMRFTEIADDLIKAIGHKYVRRIPKGVTKTGAIRYIYFYHDANRPENGQEKTPIAFSDIVKDPKRLSKDVRNMKKLPTYLYLKNADDVVDHYLSDPKLGQRFTVIPDIKEKLKAHINKKQGLNVLDEKSSMLLKNTLEALGLQRQPATLDNLPFLLDADILHKLFDVDALNVARDRVLREQHKKQYAFEDKFEKLLDNPEQLSKDVKSMQQLPSYLYSQNADHVIDVYLSDAKLGGKFADVPHVRNILKDQITKKQGEPLLDDKGFKQLKNTIEAISLRNESIDLQKMPFLLTANALNNLFDTHALNVARDVAINDRMK
jgi:hypothetical protein